MCSNGEPEDERHFISSCEMYKEEGEILEECGRILAFRCRDPQKKLNSLWRVEIVDVEILGGVLKLIEKLYLKRTKCLDL